MAIRGYYFSAHWCGPCRNFTPLLISLYNDLRQGGIDERQFEIFFVSSDRNREQFDEYFETMPWKDYGFDDKAGKMKLVEKFGVRGIPDLVFVDENGNVLIRNGREVVTEHSKDAQEKRSWSSMWRLLKQKYNESHDFHEKKTV